MSRTAAANPRCVALMMIAPRIQYNGHMSVSNCVVSLGWRIPRRTELNSSWGGEPQSVPDSPLTFMGPLARAPSGHYPASAMTDRGLIRVGVTGCVGNTPLILLRKLSDALGREILGKAEHLNPGASVKDRAAKFMIDAAETAGTLRPFGTIIEGTAGNTGIGLAMLALARGYRAIIVMPDNQSPEKYAALRALRAEVRTVKATRFADPNHFYHTAKRLSQELDDAVWTDQFENPANAQAHYETTGPEIWRQTEGRIDALVMSSGTGGTIGGTSCFLKEKKPTIRVVLADPPGSGLYSYIKIWGAED